MPPPSAADVTMEAVVEFKSVSYTYPARHDRPSVGVTGIDLSIVRGEVVALVGRSGSGKSTLLKLANRTLVPEAGSARGEGRDTREGEPILRRRRSGYALPEPDSTPQPASDHNR